MKEAIMLGKAQAEDQSISKCARVNVVWCVCSSLVKLLVFISCEAKTNQKMLGLLMTLEGKRNKPFKMVRILKIDINEELIKNQILKIL